MKRVLLLLVTLTLLLPGGTAQAARTKNARPRTDVTATALGGPDREGRVDYLIRVDARDPDGRITEIAVDFGDGAMVFLLLACDPETQPPGTTVTQEISWNYGPGHYTIRAWAYSSPDCVSGPFQQSRPALANITVP